MQRTIKTAVSAALLALAVSPVAHAGLTGHIDVVSKYILRGITNAPESDGPAVQGGVDYVSDSGFYAGYWFSTLSYSYQELDGVSSTENSTEHDFYAGYNGKIGELGYTIGGTIYYYSPGWESTAYETKLGLSYGAFGLTAQTLLNDVTFGNTGDTYWVASYTTPVAKDFTFTGQLGLYTYEKDGDFVLGTTESAGFRHLTLGVTRPLGATGATWGLQYIIGGDDRFGVKQNNQLVGSLVMSF